MKSRDDILHICSSVAYPESSPNGSWITPASGDDPFRVDLDCVLPRTRGLYRTVGDLEARLDCTFDSPPSNDREYRTLPEARGEDDKLTVCTSLRKGFQISSPLNDRYDTQQAKHGVHYWTGTSVSSPRNKTRAIRRSSRALVSRGH